jgi:hypothetical protein
MTIIYRFIVILMTALVIWELFHQEDLKSQATAAFVLAPLIMRALMIA